MGQSTHNLALAAPLPAKQARSRKTRDALIAAGWKLLRRQPWDGITINDIVAAADVSVGSFYTRFKDRDAFFESLAAEWIEKSRAQRSESLGKLKTGDDYLAAAILGTYRGILEDQHFWRAALVRGASEPLFWRPFRDTGLMVIDRILALRQAEIGRTLRDDEILHIRFAFQMANGLINNSIVNRPGPILPDTPEFETELVRGLKAVAGF